MTTNMFNSKKAHIVEDEQLVREHLRQCLNILGIDDVVSSKSFRSGIEKQSQQGADIVFLDIELGDGNGIDLLKHIKQKNEFTKVIMVSSLCTSENVKAAMNNGASGFLMKPYTISKLANVLKRSGIKVKSLH